MNCARPRNRRSAAAIASSFWSFFPGAIAARFDCGMRSAQRALTLRFFGLGKMFLGVWLLWTAQPLWASFTLVSNGVVTQLPTGLSTIDTLSGAVLDSSGNLYLADTSSNEIIVIAANGTTTSVLSITGLGSPGLISPGGLTIDGSGNLYIADTGNSRIVKVSSAGAASVISTSSITLNAPQGVAIDVSGNIFISDTGNSRIIKIPSGGTAAVFAISGLTSPSGLSNPKGIAVDPGGNLYIADSGNNRVVRTSPSGVAGTSLTTAAGTALDGPSGVAVGNNGMLYVADTNTTEFNPTPGRVVIVDSQGDASELLTSYPVFNLPRAVAISPMGNLYVVDNGGTANAARVQSFQSYYINYQDPFISSVGFGHVQLGGASTTIAIPFDVGLGVTLSSIGVNTSGTPNLDFTIANDTTCVTGSEYEQNTDCTVDVTFSPTAAGLRKGSLVVNTSSSFSLTVPLYGIADAPVVALSPAVASVLSIGSTILSSPFQTAVDGAGNIYVTNYGANTVTKIPAGGGTGTAVSTGSFTLSEPTGVALDATGDLFIADYGNSRIIEINTSGVASLFAITGLSQSINLPTALAFDGAGNLYITDYGRGRIVEVNPFGQGTVVATTGITFTAVAVTGDAVDALGNVYVADRTTNQIIKITPQGYATILNFSSIGTLSSPEGVAADSSGNIYVMDSNNQRIIRMTTTGATAVMSFSGLTLGSFIFGITPDSNGNVLVADWLNNRLVKVNVGQSALSFATTNVGSTSSDSPKITTVTDLGDQNLVLTGNLGYTLNFSENSGDTNLCTSTTNLLPGTLCDVSVNFTPQAAGSLSANLVVTDNTLNVASSTQNVSASGTGIQTANTTATAVSTVPTTVIIGQSISITAVVTDTTAGHTATVPTGTVTLMDTLGSTVVQLNGGSPVTLNGSGDAVLNGVVLSGVGTHTITAIYSGVANSFLTSSNTATVQVAPLTTTTTTLSVAPTGSVVIGASLTFTATISPVPTGYSLGTVNFYDGTTLLGSGNVNSSGVATFSSTSLPVGADSLTAVYLGNSTFATSTSTAFTETVNPLTATATALAVTPNPSLMGASTAFTATISPVPTGSSLGTVSFYDGTTLLGSGNVNSSGIATFSTTSLPVGANSLTAVYSGNSGFATSTSTAFTETVAAQTATATTLAANPNPATTGQTVTLTATVAPAPSGSSPGTVSFYDGSTLLGTETLNSSGVATFTSTSLPGGALGLTAVYSGNASFAGSTSSALTETVNPLYTVTAPAAPVTVTQGGSVQISVNVPPLGGAFNEVVTMSATGLPPGATATFNPPTVTPGSAGAPTALTIQLAPQAAGILPGGNFPYRRLPLAWVAATLGLFSVGWRRKNLSARGKRILGMVILAGATFALLGCGGGFQSPPTTQPGSFVVTITGTSGALQASTTVTVVVL